MNVPVNRIPYRIEPDPRRTIARFFNPGGDPRAKAIIARVSRMPESEASALLRRVEDEFGKKHRNIREIFLEHYQAVLEFVPATTSERSTTVAHRRVFHDGIFGGIRGAL